MKRNDWVTLLCTAVGGLLIYTWINQSPQTINAQGLSRGIRSPALILEKIDSVPVVNLPVGQKLVSIIYADNEATMVNGQHSSIFITEPLSPVDKPRRLTANVESTTPSGWKDLFYIQEHQ